MRSVCSYNGWRVFADLAGLVHTAQVYGLLTRGWHHLIEVVLTQDNLGRVEHAIAVREHAVSGSFGDS